MGGNHPNNQTSEANQWPHHFEMLGQLLFGFIFLIVVAFLYIVRATPARFAREATTPLDVSLPGADPPPFGRRSSFLSHKTYYLRGKRAERLARMRSKLPVTGAMQGGGVAGLAQMRAKLSGQPSGAGGFDRLKAMAAGGGGAARGISMKRSGSGSGSGLLESVRFLEGNKSAGAR